MSDQGIDTRIAAFFESYRAAFERFDARAVLEHFAFPCHVTTDTGETAQLISATEADWSRQIDRLLSLYRSLRFQAARVVSLDTVTLTPRVFQARVHWALDAAAGSRLYEFTALYTLIDSDGRLRITAIAHDEVAQARGRTRTPGSGERRGH